MTRCTCGYQTSNLNCPIHGLKENKVDNIDERWREKYYDKVTELNAAEESAREYKNEWESACERDRYKDQCLEEKSQELITFIQQALKLNLQIDALKDDNKRLKDEALFWKSSHKTLQDAGNGLIAELQESLKEAVELVNRILKNIGHEDLCLSSSMYACDCVRGELLRVNNKIIEHHSFLKGEES